MPTLDKVSLDISVVLGTCVMPIHQVLRLGRGAIIELDATEEDNVKILANNLPVAEGKLSVQGNRGAAAFAQVGRYSLIAGWAAAFPANFVRAGAHSRNCACPPRFLLLHAADLTPGFPAHIP